jgi:hypothetical protein
VELRGYNNMTPTPVSITDNCFHCRTLLSQDWATSRPSMEIQMTLTLVSGNYRDTRSQAMIVRLLTGKSLSVSPQ